MAEPSEWYACQIRQTEGTTMDPDNVNYSDSDDDDQGEDEQDLLPA
jgi:hypothetical protein